MNTTRVCWHLRSAKKLAVLLSLAISVTVFGVAQADDKKPKPQPAVPENISLGAFAVPAECEPQTCPPPLWTVTFRLVPRGTALQSSLFVDLTLNTEYDADGDLN